MNNVLRNNYSISKYIPIVMLYKNQLFDKFFVEYNTRFYQYIIFSFVQYCYKPSMERRLKSYIVPQKLVNKIFKKTKSQLVKYQLTF